MGVRSNKTMADSMLSPETELLLKVNKLQLCRRIDLEESSVMDQLQAAEVVSFEQAQSIQVGKVIGS